MLKPGPDGTTLREAFASFERARGKKHPEDVSPDPLPREVAYVMEWFWELHSCRPVGPAGFLPVPASEILAWAQLHRTQPRPWELHVLRALDSAFLKIMGEK